ncbi:MAG: sterol desaturase family protein [Candidatus Binatia bacterium]|nr:sterol desaturase family protein [Candidatus Binatia bacterium]
MEPSLEAVPAPPGNSAVESLVLSIAVARAAPSPSAPGYDPNGFWLLASWRAATAKALPKELHSAPADQACTCGLLQDMAIPVLAHGEGEKYAAWVTRKTGFGLWPTEWPLVGQFLFALILVFTGANSYVQHSNIRMDTFPYRYVFATPELHRLHHSKRESKLGANFGDVLIMRDLVFGTRLEPRPGDAVYDVIGLPEIDVPQTYASHLRLPFDWNRLHAEAARSR